MWYSMEAIFLESICSTRYTRRCNQRLGSNDDKSVATREKSGERLRVVGLSGWADASVFWGWDGLGMVRGGFGAWMLGGGGRVSWNRACALL